MLNRPDPDALLAHIQAEEAQQQRGKLKIFFGAAAGVGKTYAMLDEARARRAEGIDVVAGVIVTHGRAETEALVAGLELLPLQKITYRDHTLSEFDLDGALRRRPALLLVDELAHTNAPGSRHPKRWQDVLELLDAGINVYATVNVQHLESLNDVVAQITQVVVRETIPDSILERADEVKLIDVSSDTLLQRLRDGKVYMPQQAAHALQNFFRPGNLGALRELALRRTADRVEAQLQAYRAAHAITTSWPAAERMLVGITANPLAGRLVRGARRMAAGLHAPWIVAYVETPEHFRRPAAAQGHIAETLRLAEQLGAETVTLSGEDASLELLRYARAHNVTRMVVGKPLRSRWQELLGGSVVDKLVRQSGDIDVYVISGDDDAPPTQPLRTFQTTSPVGAYGWSVALVAFVTIVMRFFSPYIEITNIAMLYVLVVVVVAWRGGRGPSILASVLGVAAFDFFFVEPQLSFAISDVQYVLTFGVMLSTGLMISYLTTRLRQQTTSAQQREGRTLALYSLSRALAERRGVDNLVQVSVQHVCDALNSPAAIFLPDELQHVVLRAEEGGVQPNANELGVAQWAYDHRQMAGYTTNTLPGSKGLYVPLIAGTRTLAVLGVYLDQATPITPDQVHLVETFASQIDGALERARLADEAQTAQVQVETEQLRNSLLSSVSHDFRTPLATITGATSSLLADDGQYSLATRRELLQTVAEESERLNRLVRNLLDMTRLEAGAVTAKKNWYPLEEVIGAALTRLGPQLGERPVDTQVPPNLPLVPLDDVLIEQVLINLLENVLKYTGPNTPIEISAVQVGGAIQVSVADWGPGLPPGEEGLVFRKFYRATNASQRGVGLGLAIAQGMVSAHGGRMWAENRTAGGAVFHFTLPLDGTPPTMPVAEL